MSGFADDLLASPELGGRLTIAAAVQLRQLVELVVSADTAPTSVQGADDVWRVHVADSLSGLSVPELAAAERIADLGAGAGFPGLVLAIALPVARIDLVESVGRKCDFIDGLIAATGVDNASTVAERAETWAASRQPRGGRESYEAVTARAVSGLAALLELSAPLLVEGGVLVAWKGQRDQEEETEAAKTGAAVGMEPLRVLPVTPYPGSQNRHLHAWRKSEPTPAGLPRRPGMAQKRPLGT